MIHFDEAPTTSPGCANEDGSVIRCRNWQANAALCGGECSVHYPVIAETEGIPWTRWIHSKGWFTMENGRVHDDTFHHHALPFCSLGCLYDWLLREHGDVVDEVNGRLLST